jgi:predicted glycoside hydrolase/deacetylase ChbG (UPF0249 family)
MKRILLVAAFITAASCASQGQTAGAHRSPPAPERNLAKRLGYPPDAKLLIVHADDLGMAHSVNAASIKALESGLVNSASIMVPCPWFSEIAAYARSHPHLDLGLHLTLTSEWTHYRWGPVMSKDKVPSLLDQTGYLYATEDVAARHIDPREAEAEIRAQIGRAREFGIQPTHLDSHMGALYQNAALFEVLLRVGREENLPVRIPRRLLDEPSLASLLGPHDFVIKVVDIGPDTPPQRWAEFYTDLIKNLEPGLTELIVHLGYDDAEMRAATADHADWGSAWRQRDYEFFTSDAFRRLLRENNIELITWREIGARLARIP